MNVRSGTSWYEVTPRCHSDHTSAARASGTSMPATVTGAIRSASGFAGRWPYRQIPGRADGRARSSQAATADAEPGGRSGIGGAPGERAGRGGVAGTSGGPAGRGTGSACVPCVSRVPSLSIAPAP
ncbi:hypothetical protein GCM10010451_56830 [Streptomyces virens]|uniref:Uncharacterized protein n=1 Tax=Streptomyces virens TaxID=285572 RepID=A0ABP6Q0K6_9ACTN